MFWKRLPQDSIEYQQSQANQQRSQHSLCKRFQLMFGMKELANFQQKSMYTAYLLLPLLCTDFEAWTIYSCCIKCLNQPHVLPLYFYWYKMMGCSPAARSWSSGTNAAEQLLV